MMKQLALLALSVALLGAACSSSGDDMPTDYAWQLTEMAGPDGTMVTPITIPTLAFEDDAVAGNASCNQYFGAYELDGSSISFGQLGSTQMFCGDPGVMEQEMAYLAALSAVDTWSMDGETLTLSSGDSMLLEFIAISQELAGSAWDLLAYDNGTGGFQSVIVGAPATALFSEDGSLGGSGGCNSIRASWKADGDKLEITTAGSTAMACENEAVEQQESRYIELLDKANTYRIDAGTLEIFDAEGMRILQYLRSVTP